MKRIIFSFLLAFAGMMPAVAQDSTRSGSPSPGSEKLPEFPGGQAAMVKFIKDSIHYPEVCRKNNVSGKVRIKFVVTSEGKISRVEVVSTECYREKRRKTIILDDSVCAAMAEEAKRVISIMPRWTPGSAGGRSVPVSCMVPVLFSLE